MLGVLNGEKQGLSRPIKENFTQRFCPHGTLATWVVTMVTGDTSHNQTPAPSSLLLSPHTDAHMLTHKCDILKTLEEPFKKWCQLRGLDKEKGRIGGNA